MTDRSPDPAVDPAMIDVLIDAYHEAQNYWSAQCFCFTSAPESLRRAAHEQAREGFDRLIKMLSPLVQPALRAEYYAVAEFARTAPSPPGAAPPETAQ